jgi:hypothetical protein
MRNLSLSNRSRSILVACALTASALMGSSVSQAKPCRPWKVDLSAQLGNPIYDEDGNLIYQDAVGEGYASHMGVIDVVGMDYFSPPEDGFMVVDGTGIFTAANGDEVWVNFDGTVVDLDTGVGTGTYVITGGTGRFTDATGSASLSSSFLDPDAFVVVADGIICY